MRGSMPQWLPSRKPRTFTTGCALALCPPSSQRRLFAASSRRSLTMSTNPDFSRIWVKSSYSGGTGGECVEWAPAFAASGVVPVRDSKNPEGPALVVPSGAWSSFVSMVKNEAQPAG
ncbi:DUF397 domain-containing protein [Streptomyces sp. NPDC020667]|uniref:DUF397 domain-containing protein n=1 Tax=Streptomyces sp. NPDC020667 TaxID=3154895 RepID=UPI00340C338D